MSTIIGAYSLNPGFDFGRLKRFCSNPIFSFASKNLSIFAKGLNSTLNAGILHDKSAFCVSGIGILKKDVEFSYLTSSDWKKIIFSDIFPPENLNGHFAAIRTRIGKTELFTDILGCRNWYVAFVNHSIVFSTQIEALTEYLGNLKLDFDALASRWLLQNQFSLKSPVKNILRLSSGSRMIIEKNNISLLINKGKKYQKLNFSLNSFDELKAIFNSNSIGRNSSEFPEVKNDSDDLIFQSSKNVLTKNKYISENLSNIENTLRNFLSVPAQAGYKPALGLSGGMDSRVVLALLLSSKNTEFDVVTFGNPEHPDSITARQICSKLNIKHRIIGEPFSGSNQEIDELIKMISQMQLIGPASEYLSRRGHNILENEGIALIDGSWGEIGRRSFYNRLLFKGVKDVENRNAQRMFFHLSYSNPDIFNAELSKSMYQSAVDDLAQVFDLLPDKSEIGIENWLDSMAWNYKFPNYNGIEQTRLDYVNFCLSPFAQRYFYQLAFSIPLSLKHNATLFKQIISRNAPTLKQFSLVKGNVTLPYCFPTLVSRVAAKLKYKLGYYYHDSALIDFLKKLENFIREIQLSSSFRNCGYYDYSKVDTIINGFYSGNLNFASALDRWLAFEIFRHEIES